MPYASVMTEAIGAARDRAARAEKAHQRALARLARFGPPAPLGHPNHSASWPLVLQHDLEEAVDVERMARRELLAAQSDLADLEALEAVAVRANEATA
jgi:hypothetical protein